MNGTLSQILGVIRYEMIMQWRRRTLIVLVGFFLLGLLGLGSMVENANFLGTQRITSIDAMGVGAIRYETTDDPNLPVFDGTPEAQLLAAINAPIFDATWRSLTLILPGIMILLIAAMPLLVEVIPLDRQYKVDQVLNTTPLPRAGYLIGKVASVWLGLLIALTLAGFLYWVYIVSRFGQLDTWLYIRYWAIVVIFSALIAAGFAVLVPAGVSSRRVAVVIGILLIPLSLWLAFSTISQATFFNVLLRGSELVSQGVAYPYENAIHSLLGTIVVSLLPFALAVLGIGVLMWAYGRLKGV